MAINFPSSPTDGQIFDSGEVTYKYDGTKGYWYAFQYESAPTGFTGSQGFTGSIGSGIEGGGTDKIFWENDQTMTADYTVTSGKNAFTAGPIVINDGIVLTVPTGSRLVVV